MATKKKASIGAVLAILAALGYGGYTIVKKGDLKDLKSGNEKSPVVEKVIDGDTIKMKNGDLVRLIGVDAPEEGECFYNESKEALDGLINDNQVRLDEDIEKSDDYDRLLRYVVVVLGGNRTDNILANDYIVRQGFATTKSSPPNNRYWDLLVSAREEAMRENRGIWKGCDYQGSENPDLRESDAEPPSEDCIIKGNISEKGYGKTYLTPGCDNYNRVKIDLKKGEQYFCSEAEAEEAGFRKATNCP